VGLLWSAALYIQRTEATVAVGLERAHAKLLGQGEGLAVVSGGLVDVRGLALCGDLSKDLQEGSCDET
jgi:hypothetical protein